MHAMVVKFRLFRITDLEVAFYYWRAGSVLSLGKAPAGKERLR